MAFYNIEIFDTAYYPEVEANNEVEAIEKAMDWWERRIPNVKTAVCDLKTECQQAD